MMLVIQKSVGIGFSNPIGTFVGICVFEHQFESLQKFDVIRRVTLTTTHES